MNEPPAPDAPPPPTEHTGGEPAQPSTPPSIETAAVAPPSIECPGCGAKLRNISIGTSVKIRCLNCGIRFSPFQASDATHATASHESAAMSDESKPKIREPKSAGYWLLRIPAILYAAGISCAFVGSVITTLYALFLQNSRYRGQTDGYLFALLYLPLMPLSAYYFFVATRSLARLEARTLKAAWNERLIQNSLPGAPGSSLPYILPLAAGPMVLFIISVVKSNQDYFRVDNIVTSGIASVACFFLAFMIDDLRQFIWRQRSMADACALGTDTHTGTRSDSRFPVLGLLPAATVVAIALFFAAIFFENQLSYRRHLVNQNYESYIILLIAMLTAFGCATTFFLTGRNFHNATNAWWNCAARVPRQGDAAEMERTLPDFPARRMRSALIVFAIVGTSTLMSLVARNRPLREDNILLFILPYFAVFFCSPIVLLRAQLTDGIARAVKILIIALVISIPIPLLLLAANMRETNDFIIFLFGVFGGNLLCLTLSQVYASVRNWRSAQTTFWKLRKNLTTQPALPSLPRVIIAATYILAAIQCAVFVCYFFYEFFGRGFSRSMEWEVIFGIPLVAFLLHFPTIWVALMAREFLLAEEAAGQLTARPEEIVEVQSTESAPAVL